MDFAHLQEAAGRAGFGLNWTALIRLAGRSPEPVLDWVPAAGQYTTAGTAHRLLTAAAASLRDRIAATGPDHLYQYADHLAEVCDQLTDADQARDDAMNELSTACHHLASLDPAVLSPDADGPAADPPPAWPTAPARAIPGRCQPVPPRPRRRRRRPPAPR